MEIVIYLVLGVLVLIGTFGGFKWGYSYRRNTAEAKIGSAEEESKRIIEDAKKSAAKAAENAKKEKLLEAKEEQLRLRNEFEDLEEDLVGDLEDEEEFSFSFTFT